MKTLTNDYVIILFRSKLFVDKGTETIFVYIRTSCNHLF